MTEPITSPPAALEEEPAVREAATRVPELRESRGGPSGRLASFGRSSWAMTAAAFHTDALRAWSVVALTSISAILLSLNPYWVKLLTDGVLHHRSATVYLSAVLIGASLAFGLGTLWASLQLRWGLQERTGHRLDGDIVRLMTEITGLEHYERPEYHDKLALLRQEREQLAMSLGSLANNLSTLFRLLTIALLLASIHPVLLVVPLFGIPSLVASSRGVGYRQKAAEATAEELRRSLHLFELATAAAPAKELRVFGLRDEMLARHRAMWREVDRRQLCAGLRAWALITGGWMIFAVGYIGAVAFVALRAAHGQATAGQLLMTITAAAMVNGLVQNTAFNLTFLANCLKIVERYLWLVDHAAGASRREQARAKVTVPDRLVHGIDLCGVTFRYPGTDGAILRNVDLHLPAGGVVAIVGENGAGKTTLVKLLARYYEPSVGTIRVDGADLDRFDPTEWRARLSAGFQDFARFELLAAHAVGVGSLPDLEDRAAVHDALVRAAADDVPDRLPEGLETQLGRQFDDHGVELSIGQWQKLALGRALMRPLPLVLVLDEPTASLDAQTEHSLFEQYAGAARDLRSSNGGITILVSHRFSTVRMADLIVVMDGGGIAEVGTHAELMAAQRLYAELYDLQARAYR